ncbi:hypothetical protein SD70_03375 [Gordoniibacillus kamchatkensis]|uniref:Response regulatory domain-containing protein n=1 Tax=Gordoniibacillus kamchatkensis TaxID=1590651 RepID=A0ABR5AM30_9BACL|nr:response regulator [Paenibacillus sp. VKM B-2647]KIL41933.1 hypothetical protein SD70_03375 [Paenibacillus sp. VKM B-2647]
MARILIADNNPSIRFLIAVLVTKSGHEVVEQANDGLEALNAYSKTNPDLLIVDYKMPIAKINSKSNGDILIRKKRSDSMRSLFNREHHLLFGQFVCRGSKLKAGDTISAMFFSGTTGVWTSLKSAKKVIVKKMFEGKIIVDRYSVDISEPVEEKTFDRSTIRQMAKESG